MEAKWFLVLYAACICGNYKNHRNLPEPLQRNLASEVRGDKTSPDYGRPNYVEKYGCIGCLQQKNIADQDQGNIAMNDIILLLIEFIINVMISI